jgi:ankyrin repeat protein
MSAPAQLQVRLDIGDKCIVGEKIGKVMYVGPVKFARGRWIGIRLNEPEGKHDGVVGDTRYFHCTTGHGLMARATKVRKLPRTSQVSPRRSGTRTIGRSSSKSSVMDFELTIQGQVALDKTVAKAVLDYENFHYLRMLCEEEELTPHGVDNQGNSVLHMVARKGGGNKAIKVLQYLFDHHSMLKDLNKPNISGEVPTMVAAHQKRYGVLRFLISVGGDIIHKGTDGTSPSVWDHVVRTQVRGAGFKAMHEGLAEQKLGRENGDVKVPYMAHRSAVLAQGLFKTAHAGDLAYVQHLIEDHGLNVNVTDKENNTCLHWIAGAKNRLAIVKYLVTMGAEKDALNSVSETPCLIAARSRAWNVMSYFVGIGCSVSVRDEKKNKSVFDYAQATLASRKAYLDGIEKRKMNGLTAIELDNKEEEDEDDGDLYAPSETLNNEDGFHNPEELQADVQANAEADQKAVRAELDRRASQMPAGNAAQAQAQDQAARISIASAGTFAGQIYGKKKQNKPKLCKINIADSGILVQYKKGAFYKRKELVDEYPWTEQMRIEKKSDSELDIFLDNDETHKQVRVVVQNCSADTLEEYIWKNIWKTVFEGSLQDAKKVFEAYSKMCDETIETLNTQIDDREGLEAKIGEMQMAYTDALDADDSKAATQTKNAIGNIKVELGEVNRKIAECTTRFGVIRQRGTTLRETYDKMVEALERRLVAERARKQEYTNKGKQAKVDQIAKDIQGIEEQLKLVDSDRDAVLTQFEKMNQLELTYASLVTNADIVDEQDSGDLSGGDETY